MTVGITALGNGGFVAEVSGTDLSGEIAAAAPPDVAAMLRGTFAALPCRHARRRADLGAAAPPGRCSGNRRSSCSGTTGHRTRPRFGRRVRSDEPRGRRAADRVRRELAHRRQLPGGPGQGHDAVRPRDPAHRRRHAVRRHHCRLRSARRVMAGGAGGHAGGAHVPVRAATATPCPPAQRTRKRKRRRGRSCAPTRRPGGAAST